MPKVIPTDLPSKASVWSSDTIFLIDGDDNNTMKRADANTFRWPQGIQGVTGATWPQGVKWDTWATGAQWLQGVKGDTWDTWPQWLQGIQWLKGDKWDKGDTWDTWPQWPQGTWSGDMLKSVYDPNNDGKVSAAETADVATSANAVDRSNVQNRPTIPWSATTSQAGIVEIATQIETNVGTDTTKVITPATLKAKIDASIPTPNQFLGNVTGYANNGSDTTGVTTTIGTLPAWTKKVVLELTVWSVRETSMIILTWGINSVKVTTDTSRWYHASASVSGNTLSVYKQTDSGVWVTASCYT